MTGTRRRWAYALALGYPLLMIVAIRSVQQDDNGLRVLWPAIVMALPVALLRRHPLIALSLMTGGAVAVVSTLGPGDVFFGPRLAVVVAVGAVVAASRPRVGVGAAAVAWGALAGAEIGWRASYSAAPERIAVAAGDTQLLFSALLVAVSVAVGLLLRQRREHADSMRAQAASAAIIGERLRIARELHDSVAHRIGIIALQAGAANRVFDTQPTQARQAIGVVESASREALAELRRMLGGLRANDLGGLRANGLGDPPATGLADLPKLVSATAAAGVRVDVRWLGPHTALPPEIDRSAFRIVQEAVTNVIRHAGVDSCRVTIEHADGALAIEVLDDGQSPPGALGTGHGLVGMRERVALLHGYFSAGPRVEGGFRVAARLPMPVAAA
ncbi:two-component sensor histidine kinase [Asanoa ferruginea]|nr:sensor histidine kinase [Asanoa ferruginea]GIF48250.1 two-component sensor histidine kinase [Asanoa ferruginea]